MVYIYCVSFSYNNSTTQLPNTVFTYILPTVKDGIDLQIMQIKNIFDLRIKQVGKPIQ